MCVGGNILSPKFGMLKWQCVCLLVYVVQLVVGAQLREKVTNTKLIDLGETGWRYISRGMEI